MRLIYRDYLDIELDPYADISAKELRRVARAIRDGVDPGSPVWRTVTEPRSFDVVLMRIASATLVAHVGVVVSSQRFLHVEDRALATIVPFDHPLYRHRIAAFARHKDME